MASLYFLVMPVTVVLFVALSFAIPGIREDTFAALNNSGNHGLSEVVYAFVSGTNNNGSAFAGLSADTPWLDTMIGLAMLIGRFLPIMLVLSLAGSLAKQDVVPETAGTMKTDNKLFVGLLVFVIFIISALTFFRRLLWDRWQKVWWHNMSSATANDVINDVRTSNNASLPAMLGKSLPAAFRKFSPAKMRHNPVMFVVWVGAAFLTLLGVFQLFIPELCAGEPVYFTWIIAVCLWATVLFANLAEAVAEGRGKAQADALRKTRTTTPAHLVRGYDEKGDPDARSLSVAIIEVPSSDLKLGDVVVVEAGQLIPGDGDIISGIASVDESAITGESAPVIRESGGDRSAVTGGTRVLSDRIVVRITQKPGESFVDKMIALVEGANRQKTPNEIALDVLLSSLTIIFLIVVMCLNPQAGAVGTSVSLTVLVALLVCLIPTTIGALLSAIGIAGMDRLVQRNVLATSGRAIEAAGDVTALLLDKTGTITYGNRQASEFHALPGIDHDDMVRAAALSSLADSTPEASRSSPWPNAKAITST